MIDANTALKRLLDGNARYVSGKLVHPDESTERRLTISGAQAPFAVVLGCSDSRVPPEIIFDEGLGDLFIIRVAGNIVDSVVIGSLEYAVKHLGVGLILVLGHLGCGAVQAVIAGGEPHTHIQSLVRAIRPAVEAVTGQPGDLASNAVASNVRHVVGNIKSSEPILRPLLTANRLRVCGAVYHLDSGQVRLLDWMNT